MQGSRRVVLRSSRRLRTRLRATGSVAQMNSFWLRPDILHRLELRKVDLAQGLFQRMHVHAAARDIHRETLHQNDAELALFFAGIVFLMDRSAADGHVLLVAAVAFRS